MLNRIKVLCLLIIFFLIGEQNLKAAQTAQLRADSNDFIKTFIETLKSSKSIRYDHEKDEFVVLLDPKMGQIYAAWALLIFVAVLCAILFKLRYDPAGPKIEPDVFMFGFMAVGLFLVTSIWAIITMIKGFPKPMEYFKFTPNGLYRCFDLVLLWKDIAEQVRLNAPGCIHIKGCCIPDPAHTKAVVRYRTINGSKLFDLEEQGDPLCVISARDFQKIISYYIEKYGAITINRNEDGKICKV